MPTITRIFVNAGAIAIAVALQAPCASAQTAKDAKPTIVLVHGAFADGSSWQRVIPILQRDGYTVIAGQNPLTSLAADAETTKHVVDAQTGPVVLVGHTYGGAVITEAAAGRANLKALLYVAAVAPQVGGAIRALGERYPTQLGARVRTHERRVSDISPAPI